MDKENSVSGVLKTNEVMRDERTYKEVLTGEVLTGAKYQSVGELIILQSPEKRYYGNKLEQEKGVAREINFDLDLPLKEMEWLTRSAVGRIEGTIHYLEVQKEVNKRDINCVISSMGGITVLLTFSSRQDMETDLNVSKSFWHKWFETLEPWNNDIVQHQIAVWVFLEEVHFRRGILLSSKLWVINGDRSSNWTRIQVSFEDYQYETTDTEEDVTDFEEKNLSEDDRKGNDEQGEKLSDTVEYLEWWFVGRPQKMATIIGTNLLKVELNGSGLHGKALIETGNKVKVGDMSWIRKRVESVGKMGFDRKLERGNGARPVLRRDKKFPANAYKREGYWE
ncbi:hypothetical protein REPUB_Repub03eG0169500 [Reevesia pubescens]